MKGNVTGKYLQLFVTAIKPGEEIGEEVRAARDGVVPATKAEAGATEEHFDGKATE